MALFLHVHIFHGIQGGAVNIPPMTEKPEPEMSVDGNVFEDGTMHLKFSHEAKDPVTPGFITPDLDLNGQLLMNEDKENGTLSILGSFTGDTFPSAEAFITDQSKNNLFLGASMETGGVHSLFGENKSRKFNVSMQVLFNSEGNFIGVKQGDRIFSVQEWNQQIQDSFK